MRERISAQPYEVVCPCVQTNNIDFDKLMDISYYFYSLIYYQAKALRGTSDRGSVVNKVR